MLYPRKRLVAWMLMAGVIAFSTVSCEETDDVKDEIDDTSELEVENQVISQNMINVEVAEVPRTAWIVVHRDNGNNGPVVPGIISNPEQIPQGESENVKLQISSDQNLTHGEKLWIMIHEDTGVLGDYEFTGEGTPDQPLMDDGSIVMKSIIIESPRIDASAASYNASTHSVTIPSVESAVDGWLVIHNDDGSGNITLPGIIGKEQVNNGLSEDVEIALDNSVTVTPGQKLFPMLHIDNGDLGTYEFDGSASSYDPPEIFSNEPSPANIVVTSFTVQ